MTKVCHLLFCLFVSLLIPQFSAAQEESPVDVISERPSINGEPTEITVNMFLMDLEEIDDVEQRFSVDLFLVGKWHDPRLALTDGLQGDRKRWLPIDEVWTPRMLVLNDRGLESSLRQGVEVDASGQVLFKNRFHGELSANLEFREFPFDRQILPIDLISYEYSNEEVTISEDSKFFSSEEEFSIEGWTIEQMDPVIHTYDPPAGTRQLPRITFYVQAERDSEYYTLTMLAPMALIIFMAWTVFWLQPDIVPPRIAISTAAIFSLIALGVSIRLGLPKVSYLTKADIFVLGCTLMVFVALGIAVAGSRLAKSDRMDQALKINAVTRWVYMLLFVGVSLAAAFY